MSKKRVLFGAVDIGYRIEHYSQFINENFSDRLEAESFSKYVLPSSHFKTSYTYTCEIYKKTKINVYLYTFCFFIYALFRYDIFHFLSGELILTRKLRRLELWTYRKLDKKVIMHFVGADIRSQIYLDWKRENIHDYLQGKENPMPMSEDFQIRLISDSIDFADHIIVSTPDLLEIIPSATFLPVLINERDLPVPIQKPKSEKLRILFSPSSHRTKGSEYIHDILVKFQEKHKDIVEVILPGVNLGEDQFYALTRYELLKNFQSVDIVIDQMIIGWYGLKSVEALYYNCQVVCYIDDKYKNFLFTDCPIVPTNILNLHESLENLISQLKSQKSNNVYAKEWAVAHHCIDTYKNQLEVFWN